MGAEIRVKYDPKELSHRYLKDLIAKGSMVSVSFRGGYFYKVITESELKRAEQRGYFYLAELSAKADLYRKL
jgi:hypothetical protein